MVVYKTTNTINNKIYIGLDTKNNPSYIGSGLLLKRAINKYGIDKFKKEIIYGAISIEDLREKEKYFIFKFNSVDKSIGYNIALGGAGGDTYTHDTEENKEKRKERSRQSRYKCRGKIHKDKGSNFEQLYGNDKSKIIKEKISLNHADCKGDKNPNFGNNWTSEQKENLSIKKKLNPCTNKATGERHPHSKKVRQFDLKGNFIKEFVNVTEASKYIGISISAISHCCTGRNKTCAGYLWRFI